MSGLGSMVREGRGEARTRATPARAPADAAGPGRELALDGLRGIAVAVVVAFHLGWLQGGFLGVDLFFVLSGFLITSLLLSEAAASATVGLRDFWARRARRLLPALFLVIVGIGALLLAFTAAAQRPRFRGEMLATLGYVANWERVYAQVSYWDMFTQPSPLDHMWSLAIEEQFYVVWPLVVLGVARFGAGRLVARNVTVLALLAAVGSLVWLAAAYQPLDTNWAYFSTPTRLGPTLLGSALAASRLGKPRGLVRPGPPGECLVLAALGTMAWLVADLNGTAPTYYRGGLALFAVAAVVVIHGVTNRPPGLAATALSWWPLRALGAVSYGVYLWHWPVIVYATPERAHVDGLPLDLLRIGLTLAAAGASYHLVEQPIRQRRLRGRRLHALATTTAVATLAVTLTATYGTTSADTSAIPDGPLAGSDTLFLKVPAEVPPDATRLLLVGDSGTQFLGPELIDVARQRAEAGRAEVAVAFSSEVSCTPANPDGVTRQPDGKVVRRDPCHDHRRTLWGRLVEEFDPDVVVYYLANAGGIGEALLDGEWVLDCDPAYDEYIARTLRSDADLLGAGGAQVVFTTTPYLAVLDGRSSERVDCRNETLHEIAAARPGTKVVDLNSFVVEQSRAGTRMFADSIHLSPPGGQLVSRWLLPLVVPGG